MTKWTKILGFALAILFTGCASTVSPELMKKEIVDYNLPKLPEKGKAIVYTVRPSFLGGIVKFNMHLDDKTSESEMGYTRAEEYIYFNLTPGTHTLYSDAENWADITVTVKAGDIVFIEQIPSMGILYARNSLNRLENYKGTYHVKKLKLGTILKQDK